MSYKFTYHDQIIRAIGIPAFGILIPVISGLPALLPRPSPWLIISSFLIFIFLSFIIWQGNRLFLIRIGNRISWMDEPATRIIYLLLFNVCYTSLVTIVMVGAWFWIFTGNLVWQVILTVSLIDVVCVLFVTHSYETVLLFNQWNYEKMERERAEKMQVQSELTALKNQIDPHFMFNSLNTLHYLVRNDQQQATAYLEALAEVYRYVLDQKKQDLVLLDQELGFMQHLLHLFKLRYENAFIIKVDLSDERTDRYLITSNSLMVPFENALKHNQVSASNPLQMDVMLNNDYLMIRNKINPRSHVEGSLQLGLRNLAERIQLSTGKIMEVSNEAGFFGVKLPLVKLMS